MSKCNFIFSGVSSYRKRLAERGVVGFNELVSYWELQKRKNCFDEINELSTKRGIIMVDSGAFSAFTQKKAIDVPKFIEWHQRLNKECPQIFLKAGLDDIGNWEVSKANQEQTDAAGLELFPTYHRKDPQEYLDWMLSRDYKFWGLGGIATGALTEADQIGSFLDDAFTAICDSDGRAKIKAHLFGISNIEFLQRYPGYSNDSTSALMAATYGSITLPTLDPHSGVPNWTKPMTKLVVSSESNARAQRNAHYLTLRPGQQENVKKFIESFDFDVDLVMSKGEERQCFCHVMLMEQAKNYPSDVRFKPAVKEFDIFG